MHSKYVVRILTLSLVFFASGTTGFGNVVNANSEQARLHDLAMQVAGGSITKIEVLEIPPDIETRTRITPEMLERQFYYKPTFELERGSSPRTKLTAAMESTSVNPQNEAADLRWAMLFYSYEGKRVGAIYFDANGKRGYLDETAVSFTGGLFQWVDSTFSNWL